MAFIKNRRTDAPVVNDKIMQNEEPLDSYHIVAMLRLKIKSGTVRNKSDNTAEKIGSNRHYCLFKPSYLANCYIFLTV